MARGRTSIFKEKDYILFNLEAKEKQTLQEVVDRINGYVDQANQRITDEQYGGRVTPAGRPQGSQHYYNETGMASLLRQMTQDLTEEFERDPEGVLVRFRPEIAIALGILTRREALREGVIPLTKADVIRGDVSLSELPEAIFLQLEFSDEELAQLHPSR